MDVTALRVLLLVLLVQLSSSRPTVVVLKPSDRPFVASATSMHGAFQMDFDGKVLNSSHVVVGGQCKCTDGHCVAQFAYSKQQMVQAGVAGKQEVIVIRSNWATNYFHSVLNEAHRYFLACCYNSQ